MFIGEVAFGAGAQSMVAGWPHSVATAAFSASISSELESELILIFLFWIQDFDWSDS